MPKNRPNVIILITDDQGYGDLGCHGNPVALTPEMDRLHNESVRFVDFHAAPMCTPTRGQLFSGLDACRNGAVNVSSGRTMLSADLPTIADQFQAGGYRTGVFGKWHLGDNYPYRPQDRGFQESLWFPSSHISSLPDYWCNDYFDDVYCHNGERVRQEGYCTEVFFDAAMAWMGERVAADEPFLCYLPTNAPHYPLFVPKEDREALEAYYAAHESELGREVSEEDRARIIRFLAMIHNVDSHLGKLREFLVEQSIDRDTILIFMTDNGSTFGPLYYNAGMRGGKVTLWEGGHKVPCFVRWPGGDLGEPRDIGGLTEVQDILPTLAELCGIPLPEGDLDGISLAGVLRGEAAVPEDRVLCVNYSRMPRTDYPTPDARSVIRREGAAVMWRRWRLLEGTALYNLDEDPAQERNVFNDHPHVAQRMTDMLDAWWTEVEADANAVQRVIIGSDEENPSMLTACEWRDVFVDQQFQVRVASRKNSYWDLYVAQAGRYRFELRRWPVESGIALDEGCEATVVADGMYEEGVALPIRRARMMVARQEFEQDVAPGQLGAVFEADLESGPTLLHTWFDDDKLEPLFGAYYVYVERLD